MRDFDELGGGGTSPDDDRDDEMDVLSVDVSVDVEDDANAGEAPGASQEDSNEGQDETPHKPLHIANPKNNRRPLIVGGAVAAVLLVVVVLVATHVICFHEWEDATCTQPATCAVCGRTQGEALGHSWEEATCRYPKTCSRCGETQGSALGHIWVEATCTEPKTCSRCGSTTSDGPLGHEVSDWTIDQEATCVQAGSRHGTCARCGEEVTESIAKTDHTPGDWTVSQNFTVGDAGTVTAGIEVRTCTVCGEQLESRTFMPSEDEIIQAYSSSCQWPSFDNVARDPDSWDGVRVAFTGEVIQVLQSGTRYTLRVNVTPVSYGYTDTIMVYYVADAGDSRILEDDVITLYGIMNGTYTYESVLGASITVPFMNAAYITY